MLQRKGGLKMAWNVMEQLNKNAQKAAVGDETPKARFRTKDISIKKLYSNDKNFYSVTDIEPLAQKILLVGLIENLEVVHDPCDRGEYRITAGERRWRALKLLVEKGYTDFEMVTCQIQTPASADEEMLRLIIANDYRNKTVADILEEEKQLKDILQRMRQEGRTIKGYKLDSGRLRDVIAKMLQMPATKIAQIESINKHLIPEFAEELKEGRLTFSAAYEISGMNEEAQAEMLERYQENGLTYKEVKEIKQEQEEKAAAEEIEGQMDIDQFIETEEEIEELEDERLDKVIENITDNIEAVECVEMLAELGILIADKSGQARRIGDVLEDVKNAWGKLTNAEKDRLTSRTECWNEWEDAHPESITSLCYSCKRYSDCNVKTGTCQSCDQYINKAEAEKTEEERYSEEQDAIDRETAKKLREKADEEKMQQLPSQQEKKVHDVKLGATFFDDVKTGRKTFELRKNDRGYKEGDTIVLHEYKDGTATGRTITKKIVYMLEDFTGLEDGYCILGLGEVEETLQEAATGAGQDADNRTLQYGA
jgi:ParB family chromosome partitioning protein